MERASTLTSSQTGVDNLSLNLSPAEVGVGQTEVIATVQGDPGVVHGSVLANNGGVPADGKNLFGVAVSAENLLGMGDLWSAQAFRSSQDALTGVLSVALPVGVRGWRAVGQYSRSDFSILVGNGQVTGTSTSVSAGASYPLVLQFDRVANFEADIGSMNSQSTLSGASSQQLENRTIPYADVMLSASSGVAAASRGEAVWVGGMTLTEGDASDTASATNQDAATSNVLHTFTKLNAQYAIQQPLGGSRYFDFSVRGQLSSRNLDYSEAMGIGGPTGLRAYPVDEGEFDDGFISTVALQRDYALDSGVKISPSVFIDYAHGNSYRNVWANWNSANPSLQNTLTLADYGIGISATYRKFSTSLTLAHSMPSSPVSVTEPNSSTQLFWAGQWGF
jgi:hemolysin activation/secretion protein